ncbi:hypothetical protein RIVM261_010930 [Rivularia sp. IAM M-261]|nr:hypothetical protein RIVM261_010930 [Rivularia sp. IAM M-261]
MKETVYIETSIIGYLTARPTTNLIIAANIEVTQQWWNLHSSRFTLYVSKVVFDEVAKDDLEIAAHRLDILRDFPVLELNTDVKALAAAFLSQSNLPSKASDDAVHIAAATVHKMNYLLTWNCKHIANAQIQRKLSEISLDFGYELPRICTPYQLMGESIMWEDEILEEIRQIREEHTKSFNYDLNAMFADWEKRQYEDGRQVVNLSQKPRTCKSLHQNTENI